MNGVLERMFGGNRLQILEQATRKDSRQKSFEEHRCQLLRVLQEIFPNQVSVKRFFECIGGVSAERGVKSDPKSPVPKADISRTLLSPSPSKHKVSSTLQKEGSLSDLPAIDEDEYEEKYEDLTSQ